MWGESLRISGKRFQEGDVVEFVHLLNGREEHTPAKTLSVSSNRIMVEVPQVGPGYLRVRRGNVASHGIPINVYPPS